MKWKIPQKFARKAITEYSCIKPSLKRISIMPAHSPPTSKFGRCLFRNTAITQYWGISEASKYLALLGAQVTHGYRGLKTGCMIFSSFHRKHALLLNKVVFFNFSANSGISSNIAIRNKIMITNKRFKPRTLTDNMVDTMRVNSLKEMQV